MGRLTKLDQKLPQTKLANLKVFNHTYLIITRNIHQEIQQSAFKQADKMLELDLNFANYYFQAFESYQNNQPISEAWKIAFNFCENKKSYRLIYLILGANAHINNDLPFSLKQVVENEYFYSDYQKVQKIIDRSVNEVLDSINKMFPSSSYIDRNLIWVYEIIIKFLIRKWRRTAWNNYLKLKQKKITANEIKKDATDIARQILLIANLIGFS